MFYHFALALAAFAVAGLARADFLSLAEIRARNGVLLSAEDLQTVLPGARVVSRAPNGDTRAWTNSLNGRFVASTDARGGSHSGGAKPHSGQGSWRIDHGAYCVTLQWLREEERWCRYMYRIGNKYYGVHIRAEDSGRAMEFEFSK